MDKKSLKHYISEISCLLKDYARQAKVDADHPKEGDSADFNDGFLMAYHQLIAVMNNQAPFFDLMQEDVNLADIEPERDLFKIDRFIKDTSCMKINKKQILGSFLDNLHSIDLHPKK